MVGKPVEAATSSTINFQARLQGSSGAIVPDGFYNVQFKLYSASAIDGGETPIAGSCTTNPGAVADEDCLWTESYLDTNGVTAGNDFRVRVQNGYLSVALGSRTAFPTTIDWDQELWLTMNIGGVTQTATPTYDGEMSPRLALTAVPYAFKAGQLAKQTGSFESSLGFDTQTASRNLLLPDESGTLCIRNSTACGFAAASGSGNYINNNTVQQTANFNISGNGTIGGTLTVTNGGITAGGIIAGLAADMTGYKTSNTGASDAGKWTKLATCTLNAQYNDCRTNALVTMYGDGNGTTTRATIDWRVKQQSAFTNNPVVGLTVSDVDNLTPANFSSVVISNGGPSVVELWGQIPGSYQSWAISPVINTSSKVIWQQLGGFQSALPTGLLTTAGVYSSGFFTNLTVSGTTSTQGANLNTGGITNAGAIGGATTITASGAITGSYLVGNGAIATASSGSLTLKLGRLDAMPSNATDAFIGINNGAISGGIAGDLVLIPRSTAVNASIRLLSGNTTPVERLRIDSTGLTSILNGVSVTGGLDNNSGGITEAGAISGASTIAASGNISSSGGTVGGTQLTSSVATGTAPITVNSTTKVTSLNADLLDGLDSTAFAASTGSTSYIQNGTGVQAGASFNVQNNGTIGGDLILGEATIRQGLNDILGGSAGWFKIGTVTLPQNGSAASIKVYGGSGYNAADSSNGWIDLMVRTGNGSSTGTAGFGASANAIRYGQTTTFGSNIKLKSNVAGATATQFEVYMYASAFPGDGFYTVDVSDGGSWTNGLTTAADPGVASSTIYVVPAQLDVNGILQVTSSAVNLFGGMDLNNNGIIDAGAIAGVTTLNASGNITSTAGVISMQGTGDNYFAGSIGIGTTAPSTDLGTAKGLAVAVGNNDAKVLISSTGATKYSDLKISTDARSFSIGLGGSNTGSDTGRLYIYDDTAAAYRLTINSSGTANFTGAVVSSGLLTASTGLTVSANGITNTGGIDNNNGGITEAGAVSGATTIGASGNISSSGGTISGTQLNSTVTTGTAPLTVASTTMVTNLNSNYLNGVTEVQLAQNLRAGYNLTGGGTISLNSGGTGLAWNARMIVIANGNGTDSSTSGYFDINMPANGTVITGVGGASNATVASGVIPFAGWQALYYILPNGSNSTTVNANFRLVSFGSAIQVPSSWVLLAVYNSDNGSVRLGVGGHLRPGQSMTSGAVDNAVFNTSVATPLLQNAGTLTVAATGANQILMQTNGTTRLTITSGGAATFSGTLTSTGLLTASAGLTVSATGINNTGGLDNNSGGITEAGAISGASTIAASGNISSSGGTVGGTQLTSSVATGTAPITVNSTTKVTNLNADLLDGLDSSAFAASTGSTSYIHNSSSAQAGANFNIGGSGTIGTNLAVTGTVTLGSATTAQKLNVAGSIYLARNSSETVLSYAYDQEADATVYYHKVGQTSSNNGQIRVEGVMGGHAINQGKANIDLLVNTRDNFKANAIVNGQVATNADVEVYAELDGTHSVYLVTGSYGRLNVNISEAGGGTLVSNPSATSTAPTGTKVYTLSSDAEIKFDLDGNASIAGAQTVQGNITSTAGTFTGNGSGLTTLNATNLSSGTINTARVSGAYGNITGVGTLTSLTLSGALTGATSISSTGNISGTTLTSTIATGTAPLTVTSTTKVNNLNVDQLDGLDSTAFAAATGSTAYIQNGTGQQAGASFNVANSGTIGTTLTVGGTIKQGNTYPVYKWMSNGGNGTDRNWKTIANVSTPTGLYTAASFIVDIEDADCNFGCSVNGKHQKYYVSINRSGGVQDDIDAATLSGPSASYVRVVKTSISAYELQVNQPADWKHVTYTAQVNSLNGSAVVTYVTSPADGATTGTIYTATAQHTEYLTLLNVAGATTIQAGGLNVTGGIDNNSGGITEAGAISGATTISASGNITSTAGTFTGNGSGLTTLNATNLSSGTINTARVSGAYGNITGVGTLTSLTMSGAITGVTTLSMSGQLTSTLAIGTAPLVVTSTTKVNNLNVDQLDGLDSTAFAPASGSANYIRNTTTQQTADFNISGNGTIGNTMTVNGVLSLAAGADVLSSAGNGFFDMTNATGYFATSSGANYINGDVYLSPGKSFTFDGVTAGNFNMSGSTGTFSTGTGAVGINGDTTLATGKTLTVNGNTLLRNSTNNANALRVQNTANENILKVDTSLGRVFIGDATTFFPKLTFGDVGANGNNAYIREFIDPITPVGDTDALQYQGKTGHYFTTGDATQTVNMRLNGNGDALFKGTADSATAFQIQDANGWATFSADTVNNRIGINGVTAPGTNLDINGGFQMTGMSTPVVGGGELDYWSKIGECSITAINGVCSTTINVLGVQNVGGKSSQAFVTARVQQTAAMGSAPVISLQLNGPLEGFTYDDIQTSTTSNTVGLTKVELYVRAPVASDQYYYSPNLNIPAWGGARWLWTPNTAWVAAMPGGTKTIAEYANTVSGNLQFDGGFQGGSRQVFQSTETAAATYNITGKDTAYRLHADSTTTNASFTTTFNLTDHEVNGTILFIRLDAQKGTTTNPQIHRTTLQMNGVAVAHVETANATPNGFRTKNFILFRTGGNWHVILGSASMAAGASTAYDLADLAEHIPYSGTKPVAGELLMAGGPTNHPAGVSAKLTEGKTSAPIGVVSTSPAETYGQEDDESVPMALTGRVPVKVSLENGPIQPGDFLTASSTPGVAMRATEPGHMIGTALAGYSGNGEAVVITQLAFGFNIPPSSTQAVQGADQLQGQVNTLQSSMTSLTDRVNAMGVNFNTINLGATTLTITGNATIQGDLTVGGLTKLAKLEVGGHFRLTGTDLPTLAPTDAAGVDAQGQRNSTVTVTGNDNVGTITLQIGDNPTNLERLLDLTFHTAFDSAPQVVLSPQGRESAAMQFYTEGVSGSGFSLGAVGMPVTGKTYVVTYHAL